MDKTQIQEMHKQLSETSKAITKDFLSKMYEYERLCDDYQNLTIRIASDELRSLKKNLSELYPEAEVQQIEGNPAFEVSFRNSYTLKNNDYYGNTNKKSFGIPAIEGTSTRIKRKIEDHIGTHGMVKVSFKDEYAYESECCGDVGVCITIVVELTKQYIKSVTTAKPIPKVKIPHRIYLSS